MNIEFGSKTLRKRYEKFAEGSKKWGAAVAEKYIQRVGILYEARDIDELYTIRSLRLHQLEGDRAGEYAITIHDRWRLIFVQVNAETIELKEVTNHYGD